MWSYLPQKKEVKGEERKSYSSHGQTFYQSWMSSNHSTKSSATLNVFLLPFNSFDCNNACMIVILVFVICVICFGIYVFVVIYTLDGY